MQPQEVLTFWFQQSSQAEWFAKKDDFDARIRNQFLDTYWQVMRGEKNEWLSTPQGRLAAIIVLDQFARNIFRNDPQAFAGDATAFRIAEEGIQKGDDKKLSGWQRYFFYLPYMHSESKKAHQKALGFFIRLPFRMWKSWISYEWAHKKVIDRFGRYPHRNAVLGRPSTKEEQIFLIAHPGW